MKVRIAVDLVSGAFYLIVSALLLVLIPSQILTRETSRVNARTFPYIITVLMMLMSLKLIVTDFVKLIRGRPVNLRQFDLASGGKSLLLFAVLIGYIALMPVIGYLPASLLMVTVFLLYFRVKKWSYYLIVLLFCAVVYIVFRYGLKVRLP